MHLCRTRRSRLRQHTFQQQGRSTRAGEGYALLGSSDHAPPPPFSVAACRSGKLRSRAARHDGQRRRSLPPEPMQSTISRLGCDRQRDPGARAHCEGACDAEKGHTLGIVRPSAKVTGGETDGAGALARRHPTHHAVSMRDASTRLLGGFASAVESSSERTTRGTAHHQRVRRRYGSSHLPIASRQDARQ